MKVVVKENPKQLGEAAGKLAAQLMKEAIAANGTANIIMATGTSQFETINQLIADTEVDWSKVVMFHLDEYIDLPISSPASFRKYLLERFISKIPPMKAYYLIDGEKNAHEECRRLNSIIKKHPIDVAMVGIGENGHLAFNDPPADFETEEPYIIIKLDENCRRQQFNEGWFDSVEKVPEKAISMSIKQIMKSKHIICSVPDERKAEAVKNCIDGSISEMFPASILQSHSNCVCYLDKASAKLLSGVSLKKFIYS